MTANPVMDEDFLLFESKVNQVMRTLEEMAATNKSDSEKAQTKLSMAQEHINEDSFIANVREDRSFINKKSEQMDSYTKGAMEMDKFTFMQQVEKDAEERAKALREREQIAQNFRTLGNEAYRKANYEKAITLYTKAIAHIKDSPILFNNRALCYIKLKNYKRGIMDCDYVLNNLEEKNMRSWLYRATAYKKLGEEKNFETSVKLAKKNNPKDNEYIDNFIYKMKTLD